MLSSAKFLYQLRLAARCQIHVACSLPPVSLAVRGPGAGHTVYMSPTRAPRDGREETKNEKQKTRHDSSDSSEKRKAFAPPATPTRRRYKGVCFPLPAPRCSRSQILARALDAATPFLQHRQHRQPSCPVWID